MKKLSNTVAEFKKRASLIKKKREVLPQLSDVLDQRALRRLSHLF